MTHAALYDLAVVGGGINGVGIACDAAGRGLKVLLLEKNDLASATSSASSKLIHGGLRYLETYEFKMVREALGEREILLKKAPHLIWPMRFVLPHVPGVRPRWMVRAGLFLYDHLARRERVPGSSSLDLTVDPAGKPLKGGERHGFSYWDCWVDDARLVVANALGARARGADIKTRTEVTALHAADGHWHIETRAHGPIQSGVDRQTFAARVLVNAAGPWADKIDALALRGKSNDKPPTLRLVKGSHIVVPRIDGANDAYLLQNDDRRVVFVLPYEEQFTLIGTTDLAYEGDPGEVEISREEENYLLAIAGRFFKQSLSQNDIRWRYSGVRPLYDDDAANVSKITRDYRLEVFGGDRAHPPRLSVYGGKVTTYRHLAEDALAKIEPYLPQMRAPWTAGATLPGGDLPDADFERFLAEQTARLPWMGKAHLKRLARRHGSRITQVLDGARSIQDLGTHFGQGLYAAEVAYLKREEWAVTAHDILWRRTKLGLHLTEAERRAFEAAF